MSTIHQPCAIAIVGMACRYPDANTVTELFANSLAQRRSFRRIPAGRIASAYFDETGTSFDRAYAQQAAVIRGFEFDRAGFRVSRASYEATDMSHWVALTVAREAIEDIRFARGVRTPANDAVRVVVGNTLTGEFSRAHQLRLRWPYLRGVLERVLRSDLPNCNEVDLVRLVRTIEANYKAPFPVPDENFLAGGLANTIAGRICNHFDFKGGGYTVDGACASSLLAVTDACTALASGDADMVLAGGVDLSLDPFELVGFSRTAALARTDMRVYDEQSAGFWPGEGCGFVVLMRHDDALSQCTHVHGVIQGWGISSDGHGGLTRPEVQGQILALQRCYARAGYGIETVGYFEGHGTGTKVGDEAELRALIMARSQARAPITPAIISSVKANIGHTKAASGLAGLLRATLCVRERLLPPTTACQQPHALFAQHVGNLAPSDRIQVWDEASGPRRAGISAMGFGGINTHLTIEEAVTDASRTSAPVFGQAELARLNVFQDAELFLFAALNRNDLAWTINHLSRVAAQCSLAELWDLAAELYRRVSRGTLAPWKAAIVAATPDELVRKLGLLKATLENAEEGWVTLLGDDGVFLSGRTTSARIGLVFSGQGSPARHHGGLLARRFDAVGQVYRDVAIELAGESSDTAFAQPAIAAASLAGLTMLRQIGMHADVAIGHSLGELCALHWAGCFDASALMALARIRGRLIADDHTTAGVMAAVGASEAQLRARLGVRADIWIANINGPTQTVLSGRTDAVHSAIAELRATGTPVSVLPVRHAFHSPLMAGAARAFAAQLASVDFQSAQKKVISTMTAQPLVHDTDLARHLTEQLLAPVEFLRAACQVDEDIDLLVEVGPGMLLKNLASGFCTAPVLSVDVGGTSLAPFLGVAGAAYVLGNAPNIASLFADRHMRHFDWSWNPTFLINPCEAIPAATALEDDISLISPGVILSETATEAHELPNAGVCMRDQLRTALAERTGLPLWILQDGNRMLSDLHLNSITVGEILADITRSRGMAALADPTEYANASITEIATALEALAACGNAAPLDTSIMPEGVGSWLRCFTMELVPATPMQECIAQAPGCWTLFGQSHPAREALRQRMQNIGDGVLVWLAGGLDTDDGTALLMAAQHCLTQTRSRFVVVQPGWGGSGFAKSFFLEHTSIDTLVLNVPKDLPAPMVDVLVREISGARPGFSEIILAADGSRAEPRLSLLPLSDMPTKSLLGKSDVVLVTGGARGISAECAYQLAVQHGCALLILGRSEARAHADLAANLERMRLAGTRLSYQQADVVDSVAVAKAVERGVGELGLPVSAVVHGAGMNKPCSIASMSAAHIAATVAPKVLGLRNVLAAIDPSRLKCLVTFSSIIARIGLQGEADYALGNEWLSQETLAFQRRYPACICRAIEWSVWSGAGMAQRLGRLDALQRQGIVPISVDQGVQEFLRLLQMPGMPVCVVLSGRFGHPATLPTAALPTRHRFTGTVPVFYPGIELVADSNLSSTTDPYLDDHVLNGERLLPAVMALEAMAEAAFTLMGKDPGVLRAVFRQLTFRQAIVVPESTGVPFTLRIAAQAQANGEIVLALRCSATGFKVNHVEARCILCETTDESAQAVLAPTGPALQFDPGQSLYRNVLFQKGRFRRIEHYHLIEARRCSGQLAAKDASDWFLSTTSQTCLLGDPGMRDAALHAIQACIPSQVVIPIAVEEICTAPLDGRRPCRMLASEVEDRGNELIYDLTIFDAEGRAIERWRRITLRLMGEPPSLRLNAPALVAPFFERRVADGMPLAKLQVTMRHMSLAQKNIVRAKHRADGKPDPLGRRFQSHAYSGEWEMAVSSEMQVGCDLEVVLTHDIETWTHMLSPSGADLAQVMSSTMREPFTLSATRVWTVREAMKKAGFSHTAPLTLDTTSSASWTVLRSGAGTVYSSVIDATADAAPVCIAVALVPLECAQEMA